MPSVFVLADLDWDLDETRLSIRLTPKARVNLLVGLLFGLGMFGGLTYGCYAGWQFFDNFWLSWACAICGILLGVLTALMMLGTLLIPWIVGSLLTFDRAADQILSGSQVSGKISEIKHVVLEIPMSEYGGNMTVAFTDNNKLPLNTGAMGS